MAESGQSSAGHCWRLEGKPAVVECSAEALRAIVEDVEAGFRMFPHGGLAVGGVLFGEAEEDRIRIAAARSIHCDHAAGPSFTLSAEDHERLAEQLRQAAEDPDLRDLVPVGWYHSHTRSGVNLTPSDLELHERHFPKPWQIAVVLRPEEDRPTKLGIFVRDAHGRMPAQPALVVEAPRAAASKPAAERASARPPSAPQPERPPAPPPGAPQPARPSAAQAPAPKPQPEPPPPPAPSFQFAAAYEESSRTSRKKWLGVAVLAAAAAGGWWIMSAGSGAAAAPRFSGVAEAVRSHLDRVEKFWAARLQPTERLRLSVVASGSNLLIRWDPGAPEFRDAAGAELSIRDGPNTARVKLNLMELMQGVYSYAPLTHDVRIEMAIQHLSGPPAVAAVRYLRGGGTADSAAETSRATPEELRLELERLRTALALEREQAATLERTLSVLQEFERQRPGRRASSPRADTRPAPPTQAAVRAAEPAAAKPEAPPVELVQSPPAVAFEERAAFGGRAASPPAADSAGSRPAATPETASSQAPTAPATPASGRLIWTGLLREGDTLTIDGGRASTGSLTGRLPGTPVRVSVFPGEFTAAGLTVYSAEERLPGAAGGPAGVTFRTDPEKAAAVSLVEAPSEANRWNRIRVRAAGTVPVIVVVWQRAE